MAATTLPSGEPAPEDTSLYPIAVLIDELKNEDVQVCNYHFCDNHYETIDGYTS